MSGPVHDFTAVPAGRYRCRVAEIRIGTTRAGDPRWALRLDVAGGEYDGRHAAWDGVVFTERGKARLRRVLRALDVDENDVKPNDIVGRTAIVQIRPVEFESPDGEVIRRNEVPYGGWIEVEAEGEVHDGQ